MELIARQTPKVVVFPGREGALMKRMIDNGNNSYRFGDCDRNPGLLGINNKTATVSPSARAGVFACK